MSQITKKPDLQHFIETYQPALQDYAHNGFKKREFWSSVKIALSTNESLVKAMKTQQGQVSLFNALKFAVKTGLSLNPVEGKACLIGYEDKNGNMNISYQIMKNGYREIAMDSGLIDDVVGITIRENDEFDIVQSGDTDDYKIKKARANRGEIQGYLAAIKFKDGRKRCEYMTKEEVIEHKNKYAKGLTWPDGKPKQDHAWNKSEEGMSIKTVVKKILTTLSISKRLDEAVGIDNFNENLPERDITPGVSADKIIEKLGETEPAKLPVPDQEAGKQKKEKEMF